MIENLFQPTHLFLVLAIALLVFGPKNLPQIGAGLGQAIADLRTHCRNPRPRTDTTMLPWDTESTQPAFVSFDDGGPQPNGRRRR